VIYRLGIDLGSASVAVALLDENNRLAERGYRLHHGDVEAALRSESSLYAVLAALPCPKSRLIID
jgi:activator of 2-hydroxyglutaryl-CoA dehydratase